VDRGCILEAGSMMGCWWLDVAVFLDLFIDVSGSGVYVV
jgi:hypothetical protein